jgi:hypothetical protein
MVSSLVGAGSILDGVLWCPSKTRATSRGAWAPRVAQHGNCADTLVGLNAAKKQEN